MGESGDAKLIAKKWAKIIGKNINGRRHRQFLTREQLAIKVGVDRTYITKMENGSRCPSIETMIKLAEHLYLKDWRELLEINKGEEENGIPL